MLEINQLHTNIYINDILTQPQSLQEALPRFDPRPLEPLAWALRCGDYDRLILTGMGASLYGAYPAWQQLAQSGLPALWLDASELVHNTLALINNRTLLWIFSQSGRSAEILKLLEQTRRMRPAVLLATTNDPESPLAQAADQLILLYAAPEHTVSTRTYLHTLAFAQLTAAALLDQETDDYTQTMLASMADLADYLAHYQEHIAREAYLVGKPQHLVLLGRGLSLAAVYNGALILGEAAKFCAVGLPAGHFRHGPLETAGPELTALIFAGEEHTAPLNRKLYDELRGYGANALWISSDGQADIPMPPGRGPSLPLAEILPIQLLTIQQCLERGVTPGDFYNIGKVTTTE